jgi:DNA-binding transcriptional regulator YhcF (GntR family)
MDIKHPADPNFHLPAYRQIADSLREMLVSGKLKPGASLPSVRNMAGDLGVHFNTVAAAYRELADEGWLDLRHGRSAQVLMRPVPKADRQTVEEFGHKLRSLAALMRANGVPVETLRAELQAVAKELKSS